MISGFDQYESLTDFINRTAVGQSTEGDAVIIVSELEGQPITLIGFKADAGKTDFEIQEEGYNYYLRLKTELERQ